MYVGVLDMCGANHTFPPMHWVDMAIPSVYSTVRKQVQDPEMGMGEQALPRGTRQPNPSGTDPHPLRWAPSAGMSSKRGRLTR